MLLEVPYSEVLDKWTILELKTTRLPSAEARRAVVADLNAIKIAWLNEGLPDPASMDGFDALRAVNAELWEVEESLRAHERMQSFGDAFVALARSVYQLNDQRSSLKRALDHKLGSARTEWKSY